MKAAAEISPGSRGGQVDSELKHLGSIKLGHLSAKIVCDSQGRKCIGLQIAERDVLFTVTQALLIREMLDLALRALAQFDPAPSLGEVAEDKESTL
jgi:hypothetical protein